ncbi:MAG: hypothetical protein ABIR24_03030 [Verrucomicrobiota bacterium]
MGEKLKKSHWHFANVLDLGVHSRRLWQFSVQDGKFNIARDQTLSPNEMPPGHVAAKSWNTIWQPKLNVAWIPADKVFLRVVQLPSSDFAETISMVELQLEKISPLPVAQIVWSVELLPKGAEDHLQTAIVIIVARDVVEEFLGQLEGQKYLADRLELPVMDELLATKIQEDGVWIYPGVTTASPYLVAWWYGGILQNVTLFSPAADQDLGDLLKQQISQVAWAGELEGWMTSPPRWHMVADGATAAIWEPILNQVSDQPVQIVAAAPQAQIASLSARRAVQSNGVANLVPTEYTTRYRQQFVDRLWMRGLGAVVILYLIGVVIYFGALQVLKFQRYRVQNQVKAISQSYTNALKMEARIRVLEDRKNLQFAALDCWKAVAELLPSEVSMDQLIFQRGKTFDLYGTVPQEHELEITDFNQALRRYKVNGDVLFSEVSSSGSRIRGAMVEWKFSCKLRSGEDTK